VNDDLAERRERIPRKVAGIEGVAVEDDDAGKRGHGR
jgi:hypothetical protein